MNSLKLLDYMEEVVNDSEQLGYREVSQPADLELPRGSIGNHSRSTAVKSRFLLAPGLLPYALLYSKLPDRLSTLLHNSMHMHINISHTD